MSVNMEVPLSMVAAAPEMKEGIDKIHNPQCTGPISHNVPVHYPTVHQTNIPQCTILQQKCAHVCTFLSQNGALWDACLMQCGIHEMGLLGLLWPGDAQIRH